ncbi:DUF1016 N-terminal domain-containing protein [Nostoc sp. UHCC 0252]|uniref:DUF1016 N-terminal domain-containing protein n=1 Tax=Nostoc sp. UHCC 0252 TaxID=3110241 RepID=UPI002B21BDB7|nr:DUF1016 N-terminal domain-containing protein [Nostoc sp. UHCC 0252]MEA5606318.1 DUF1016 N-terminal domain-containing protein [Nostoc sp. UHCC 0252]
MDNYDNFLRSLKERIRSAQVRAALSVNRELILLYWQIGRDILLQQQQQGWGAKVIERLARDLKQAFPEMKGFSARNLNYMRAFAEAYPDEQIVQQLVALIPWGHTALPAIMQYSFSPCPLLSKLSDLGMYLIAAVSAVMFVFWMLSKT